MDLYTELFGFWCDTTPSLQEDEWTIEDIQDKTNFKLQQLFSLYKEIDEWL